MTSLKARYTVGARRLATQSMTALARLRVTPNALTTAGVGLCAAASVLVYFEYRNEIALAFAFAAVVGSFLVSYTRARAEALGLRGDVGIGSRAERVVVITTGLALAPWGVLAPAIYLLAATAWFTVGQRVLSVRSQLRAR